MVDSIGPKGSTPNARIAPILGAAAAAKIASVVSTPEQQMHASHPVGQLAQELAAKPPVDAARVDQFRKAIADGSFQADPKQVADKLMSLRGEWINDAA
ncbi:MAG TPA: flagellar biosynthesis anti-sigma factor FlgM [Sphingomonas sp.]